MASAKNAASADSVTLLAEKIRSLPPDCIVEVADFVDFLRTRRRDRALQQGAARLAEAPFAEIWDNPDDAAYDRL